MIYKPETEFYVTYAIHAKDDEGHWGLKRFDSGRHCIYDFLSENNDRSDGEIAEALNDALNDFFGDKYFTRYYTVINFWPI